MSSLVIEILSFWSFWNVFSFSYGKLDFYKAVSSLIVMLSVE